ncbi:MAG: glycerol-3-phosphate acyltransferase [Chloroflexi bacterium]|nr:glycerol-3-phosphate acyltransferase [Chloroflexota bacterium]
MEVLGTIAIIVLGYLLGSMPWAYIVARMAKGVDIRQVDYGNPGAANVFRQVGPAEGIAVGILDVGKAALPVIVARASGLPMYAWLLGGIAALLGHWWPIFLGFRGGIGAATAIGALLAMIPIETLLGAPFAIGVLVILRNTGYASLLLFGVAAISALLFDESLILVLSPPILGSMVFLRARLWRRSEGRPGS